MMEKYNDGKKMPAVPKAPMPIITIPKFELKEFAPLMYANGGLNTDGNADDLTFEAHNLGWGYAAYYTMLPELPVSSVLTAEFHDFAQVFIDGKYIGKIDRVKNEKSLTIPPTKAGSLLVIVVEAMGRINFGRAIKDFKGIVGNVTISSKVGKHDVTYSLKGWEKYFVNDKYETALLALRRASATENNEYIENFKDTIGCASSQSVSPV